MNLLLTSDGPTNETIKKSIVEMSGKQPKDLKIAFVPTAKRWREGRIEELVHSQTEQYRKLGFGLLTIVEPYVVGDWRKSLDEADAIAVGGGNTYYLLKESRASGFDAWVKQHLGNKLYIGTSAGSILVTPTIAIAPVDNGDEDLWNTKDLTGLGLVDFEVSPHTPESVSYEANEAYAKTTPNPLYAYDNDTAIKVVDGKVVVIGEGEWKRYN
jgi:dipeptidase E